MEWGEFGKNLQHEFLCWNSHMSETTVLVSLIPKLGANYRGISFLQVWTEIQSTGGSVTLSDAFGLGSSGHFEDQPEHPIISTSFPVKWHLVWWTNTTFRCFSHFLKILRINIRHLPMFDVCRKWSIPFYHELSIANWMILTSTPTPFQNQNWGIANPCNE